MTVSLLPLNTFLPSMAHFHMQKSMQKFIFIAAEQGETLF